MDRASPLGRAPSGPRDRRLRFCADTPRMIPRAANGKLYKAVPKKPRFNAIIDGSLDAFCPILEAETTKRAFPQISAAVLRRLPEKTQGGTA